MKRKMLLFTLALPVLLLQNAQAQISSRLISSANWLSTGSSFYPTDSSNYMYSGGRGGASNFSPLSIDAVTYNNMPGMGYDQSSDWAWANMGDSLYLVRTSIQTFDGHNNVTSTITQNADGTPYSNTLYFYNASDMMVKSIMQFWNGSMWVSNTQHLFSYNSAGKLSLDSVQSWNSLTTSWDQSSLTTYYYDGALNMINATHDIWVGGAPEHFSQWLRTYSSTNQLLTSTYSVWTGSGWLDYSRYTHAYDVSGDPISLLFQMFNSGTMVWDNNWLDLYSNYTSSHLPQTVTRQAWNSTGVGSWDNSIQYQYMYNSYNQVVMSTGISWNASSSLYQYALNDPMNMYHYELYSNTTSVPAVAKNTAVNVYPVPAANAVNVELSWKEAQAAEITMVDMTGAVVKNINVPAAAKFTGSIVVNDLASGVYFIKINGQKEQIVKQVVVAH